MAPLEDFEVIFGLRLDGGVVKEKHNRDLTNLDLGGRGDEEGVGGRIGKFSFRMRDKNIYDTF